MFSLPGREPAPHCQVVRNRRILNGFFLGLPGRKVLGLRIE